MSNYSLPPPLPTYHVLLEGEGLGQSLGNFKDDLLNVCMRHVEKMCKADLSRNFIERNHMENGRCPLGACPTATGTFLPGRSPLPGLASSQPAAHCSKPPVLPKVSGLGFRDCNPPLDGLPRLCGVRRAPKGSEHLGTGCTNASSPWVMHQTQGLISFRATSDHGARPSSRVGAATCKRQMLTWGLCGLQQT